MSEEQWSFWSAVLERKINTTNLAAAVPPDDCHRVLQEVKEALRHAVGSRKGRLISLRKSLRQMRKAADEARHRRLEGLRAEFPLGVFFKQVAEAEMPPELYDRYLAKARVLRQNAIDRGRSQT
jgi:hypothetical protein